MSDSTDVGYIESEIAEYSHITVSILEGTSPFTWNCSMIFSWEPFVIYPISNLS